MRWFDWLRCSDGGCVKEIHYTEVKKWRWPNFTPKEISCKGDGLIVIDENALDKLQAMRLELGIPLVINSAYRSEAYNKSVGGAPKSQHLQGRAFDIRITDALSREEIKYHAKEAGFTGIGDYNTFVHVDTGPTRYWDLRT